MRHRNAGFKLGRNTSHRRALLRNLVTSVIVEDRVETTVAKAKAVRPHVEKMITLGKKGDLHSRRQALSFLMTDKSVTRLFDTVAPRYGDRQGGYLRIVRTGFRRAMAPKRPSSNCWAPKSSLKSSARSAKTSRLKSAPNSKSSSKKARRKSRAKKPRKSAVSVQFFTFAIVTGVRNRGRLCCV